MIAIHLLCGVTEDVKPFADRLGCGARVPANGAKNLVHPRLREGWVNLWFLLVFLFVFVTIVFLAVVFGPSNSFLRIEHSSYPKLKFRKILASNNSIMIKKMDQPRRN